MVKYFTEILKSRFLSGKKIFTLFLICLTLISKADYWTQKANFPVPTVFATGFSLAAKGYMGTGATPSYTSSFYEYDPALNTWTQKPNFGGAARAGAVSFAIDNLGYIGTGTMASTSFKDLWQFNPVSNTWTQKADFGGTPRFQGAGFAIGTKGYIGTGNDPSAYQKDFWEYDPVSNTWTQKTDVGPLGRYRNTGFSIGNKGYIGCGQNTTIGFVQDFWEYDPVADTWTQKADFAGGLRYDPVGFSIGNKGYIGTGWNGPTQDWWEYDPATNLWTQKANFGGVARGGATGFSIGNRGYLGIGGTGGPYLQDFWEYTPDSTTGIADLGFTITDFIIFPNPAKDELFVNGYSLTGKEKIDITISDVNGKRVYHTYPAPYSPLSTKIDLRQYSKGIYFVEVNSLPSGEGKGGAKAIKKFLKE